jgi:hypothetical protein
VGGGGSGDVGARQRDEWAPAHYGARWGKGKSEGEGRAPMRPAMAGGWGGQRWGEKLTVGPAYRREGERKRGEVEWAGGCG